MLSTKKHSRGYYMKKTLKVLLVLALVILTTGCGKRNAATPEDFKNTFKDYKVEDVTSQYAFAESALKVTGGNNLTVLYLKVKSVDTIKDIYYDEITNITKKAGAELIANNDKDYQYKEEDIEKTITKGDNYTVAQYSLRDTYYRISWIDNTYIYGTIDIGSKTTLVNLMSPLKY
jgi:predicted small lipoprotein YifL